jgi:hypothetical protein
MKVAYTGSWCISEDEVSLLGPEGETIPALLMTHSAEQLIENGPLGLNLLIVKPQMSLAERADYTLTLTPPNPRLREFDEVALSFKTHNAEQADFEGFEGITKVKPTDPCREGYTDVNADDFECVIPSQLQLELSFRALPNPEATYAIYRVSSTTFDDEGQMDPDETDELERLIGFVPGVSAERAAREQKALINTLYAPLPREECYRVELWDEWGRPRGGVDQVKCVRLTQPLACPEGCVPEEGNCTFIFPTPEPFSFNMPISGALCDRVGIYDADPETEIPAPGTSSSADSGEGDEPSCAQSSGQLPMSPLFWALFLCVALRSRRADI